MQSQQVQQQTKPPVNKDKKDFGVYNRSLLSRKIHLGVSEVGRNVKQNLEARLAHQLEGKCIVEGFIRPGSIRILNYSNGTINNEHIEFQTTFECMVCYPVEGHTIQCVSKTITKAGIHGEVRDEDGNVPINVFIARDHHHNDNYFQSIRENQIIQTDVIGVRFELNDPYICVIGELKKEKMNYNEVKGGDNSDDILLLPSFEH